MRTYLTLFLNTFSPPAMCIITISSFRPITNYYHPTLYQILSEIEDGRTPENTPVRCRLNEAEFPDYSWRGYAVFSEIQVSHLC